VVCLHYATSTKTVTVYRHVRLVWFLSQMEKEQLVKLSFILVYSWRCINSMQADTNTLVVVVQTKH